MNVRLKKELQVLFWPWLAVTLIGLLPLFSWALPTGQFEHSFRGVYLVSGVGFFLGVALLTALPFGEEFQLRTLATLLSQPLTRSQIWREKFWISLMLVGFTALVHIVSYLPFLNLAQEQLKLAFAFLVLSVCSGTFWVLVARSTIGGMVLCLFTQAVMLVLAYALTQQDYFNLGIWHTNSGAENSLLVASLFLSPFFLWCGWHRFSRLQASGNWEEETLGGGVSPQTSRSFLCSHTESPLYNLVLKELRLLKPVFVMIFLFCCLWLLNTVLKHQLPVRKTLMEDILSVLTMLYTAMLLLVAGTLSLGEEKSQGTHLLNLTLPFSPFKQWLLKYGLVVGIGFLGTMFIPVLLVKMERILSNHSSAIHIANLFTERNQEYTRAYALVVFLAVSLSFWAATVTNRTIKAVFLAVSALVTIYITRKIGVELGSSMTWLTDRPILWFTTRYQLSLGWYDWNDDKLFWWGYTIALPLLLYSCWKSFTRIQNTQKQIVSSISVILGIILLSGMVIGYLNRFGHRRHLENSFLQRETVAAILATRYPVEYINRGEDLTGTRKLSPATALWLKGTELKVEKHVFKDADLRLQSSRYEDYINVQIWFPNGTRDFMCFNLQGKSMVKF